jgi:hypothetical protein
MSPYRSNDSNPTSIISCLASATEYRKAPETGREQQQRDGGGGVLGHGDRVLGKMGAPRQDGPRYRRHARHRVRLPLKHPSRFFRTCKPRYGGSLEVARATQACGSGGAGGAGGGRAHLLPEGGGARRAHQGVGGQGLPRHRLRLRPLRA